MDNPHAELGITPHLKPRGSVAEEEDAKSSHQLHKLQMQSTRSAGQALPLKPGERRPQMHEVKTKRKGREVSYTREGTNQKHRSPHK